MDRTSRRWLTEYLFHGQIIWQVNRYRMDSQLTHRQPRGWYFPYPACWMFSPLPTEVLQPMRQRASRLLMTKLFPAGVMEKAS